VIAGDVAVMVALVAVVVAAALWRPVWQGAALLAGAVIPMAAQAISALVQVGQGTSPSQFGITPAQAAQIGLTISSGVTAAFWIYGAFVVVLAAMCARLVIRPHSTGLDAVPPRSAAQDAAIPPNSAGPDTAVPPNSAGPDTAVPPNSAGPDTAVPPHSAGPDTAVPPHSAGLDATIPPRSAAPDVSPPATTTFS
jgi:hypothetical protein